MKEFIRKISASERLYLTGAQLYPPFCIRMVIESDHSIAIKQLQKAVSIASKRHPNSRLILVKKGMHSFWKDSGIDPPVISLPKSSEKEFSSKMNSAIDAPIDYKKGPTSSVYQIQNATSFFIIFKVFHGTMDGKGTTSWVNDVFRVLKKETIIGATSALTDEGFLKTTSPKNSFRKNYPLNATPAIKKETRYKTDNIATQTVIKLPGKHTAIVAKLIHYFLKKGKINRFMIPVDLRKHVTNIQTGSNFSNPIFFETDDSKDLEWKDIYADLIEQLAEKKELQTGQYDTIFHYLPVVFLNYIQKKLQKKQINNSSFMLSGIISHMGKIELQNFSFNNFYPKGVFFYPMHLPNIASSFVISENNHQTYLGISVPSKLADTEDLSLSLKNFKLQLSQDRTKNTKPSVIEGNKKNDFPYQSIDKWLFAEVKKHPKKIALREGNSNTTYEKFYSDLSAIANALATNYKPKGTIIAIHSKRSSYLIKSIFAVIKTGAAFLLIDDSYPKDRVTYMLNDAKVTLVITDQLMTYPEGVQKIKINDFKYDNFRNEKNEIPTRNNELAYVLYTSGSTGKPKGVCVRTESLLNYLNWSINYLSKDQTANLALFSSISFDGTLDNIFPLFSGGSITLYPEPFDLDLLSKIIHNPNINAVKLTPAYLKLISLIHIRATHSIESIYVGGEELTRSIVQSTFKNFGNHITIYNLYGPTETTISSSCLKIDYTTNLSKKSVSIGTPIDNTKIYILDKNLQIVPRNKIGEIYISGAGVSFGYLENLLLTRKSFIKNPSYPDEILYKTGDLAILDDNDLIHYRGRNDHQIKINGVRIELPEIQHAILNTPRLEDVSLITEETRQDNENTKKIIIAFFTPKNINVEDIKKQIASQLPKYMIPSKFIGLDKIPYTKNGKVDRKQLLKISKKIVKETKLPIPSVLNSKELNLLVIFSEILKIDKNEIDREDSFNDLGGDSLGMLFLLDRIEKELIDTKNLKKWKKKISLVIQTPTIKKIGKLLNQI